MRPEPLFLLVLYSNFIGVKWEKKKTNAEVSSGCGGGAAGEVEGAEGEIGSVCHAKLPFIYIIMPDGK